MNSIKIAAIGAALSLLLVGCGGPKEDNSAKPGPGENNKSATAPPAATGTIQGAGATFPKIIYEKWFGEFQKAGNPAINYQAIGSGGGIKAFKEKTVDFGASDAPLSDEEEKALPGPAVHIPTVGGAVVLAYQLKGFDKGLQFTPEIIAGIYLGKIAKWNDPALVAANPGKTLPDLKITPVYRTDGSGTTYVFTNYLKKATPDWAAGPGAGKSVTFPVGIGGKGNDGVSSVVTKTEGALGYVELAFAIQKSLPFGAVKNKAGKPVMPSVETVTNALKAYAADLKTNIKTPTVDAPGDDSYPISSLTYILLYKDGSPNAASTLKLWNWALEAPQQAMAKELQYAPLPEELVKLNQEALKTVKGAQ